MKDTYYFPHDCNSIQDPKMMTLLAECGATGVGIFWIIVEILHQQQCGGIGTLQLKSYITFYGRQASWDQAILDKCERVFFESGLFFEKDGMVYSNRVINNLKKRSELSEQGRLNASKRWPLNATPMPPHSDPNAIKERKVKESKGKIKDIVQTTNHVFKKPTLEEITAYCKERNNNVDADKFFNYYEAGGWRVGRNPMKNWQAAVRTWEKNGFSNAKTGGTLQDELDRRKKLDELSDAIIARGTTGLRK